MSRDAPARVCRCRREVGGWSGRGRGEFVSSIKGAVQYASDQRSCRITSHYVKKTSFINVFNFILLLYFNTTQ